MCGKCYTVLLPPEWNDVYDCSCSQSSNTKSDTGQIIICFQLVCILRSVAEALLTKLDSVSGTVASAFILIHFLKTQLHLFRTQKWAFSEAASVLWNEAPPEIWISHPPILLLFRIAVNMEILAGISMHHALLCHIVCSQSGQSFCSS